jgi:hypothetical protein
MGQTRPTEGTVVLSPMYFRRLRRLFASVLLLCRRWAFRLTKSVVLEPLTKELDTVERNILDLAARQGLSLYTEENAAGTLNIAAFANDSSKKTADTSIKKKVQKGDFVFK